MFKFKVIFDDGKSYEVTSTTRDARAWEEQGKGRSAKQLFETLKFDDLYALAYLASVRKGLYSGSLAEFEESCGLEADAVEDPKATEKEA